MSNITPFDFRRHQVRVIAGEDGEPVFVGKDVCAALEIKNSRDAINRLDQDGVGIADVIDTLGRKQQVKVLAESALYELIFQSRVPQAVEFRRWVTREVLPSIRRHGGYIHPRASDHQLNALVFQCRAQMELAQAARGLVHPDHLEAKARIILARGMGEAPELDPTTRPLYAQAFLKEKNLSRKQRSSKSGVFGKRVKAAYIEKYGYAPPKYPLEMSNGQIRDVNAYTEADRPLLESVYADLFGGKPELCLDFALTSKEAA